MNGKNLDGIEDNSVDFIATYSVLHHIPEYLATIQEMIRVCAPGGVIYIDHEQNNEYWLHKSEYLEFKRKAQKINLKKFFVLSNYIGKVKRIFNPKYANEGDIHVWDDDHIEWDIIDKIMSKKLKFYKMISFCITKTIKNIFIMNIRIYVPICELPHIKRIFKR